MKTQVKGRGAKFGLPLARLFVVLAVTVLATLTIVQEFGAIQEPAPNVTDLGRITVTPQGFRYEPAVSAPAI